jgi:ATP-dependent helicase/DNAse subunit B
LVLPVHAQAIVSSDHQAPTLASLELNWRQRHVTARGEVDLRNLLDGRLDNYQLSPTHLTKFIDLEYGGPEVFFFDVLLRFPQAPTANSQFGNAIHETLEWIQHQVARSGTIPSIPDTLKHFASYMQTCKLTPVQKELELERGQKALSAYLAVRGSSFKSTDKAEHNFKNEGVFVGKAHMSGKVDRMEIDAANKTITVVDYKTGKPHAKWGSEPRLHRYQMQLYCYKLLIEGSHSFRGYKVTSGRIEFIEPDVDGKIYSLELAFKDDELERVKVLVDALWDRVQALDFPDVSGYEASLAGIKQFEADLISKS